MMLEGATMGVRQVQTLRRNDNAANTDYSRQVVSRKEEFLKLTTRTE